MIQDQYFSLDKNALLSLNSKEESLCLSDLILILI